jgi:cytochrome c oxidase subunit I+III
MAVSTVLALASILYWLWTATAMIPEKEEKYIGHGVRVPLYMSGPASVGWWAMLITMLADVTAFASVVFGYFFYWTRRPEFPPGGIDGPGTFWPVVALALLLAAWGLTLAGRRWNARDRAQVFYLSMAVGAVLAVAGALALLAGPWTYQMQPSRHVYPATVWVLAAWTALHVAVGVVMQLYCFARRWAGRMSARHDIDIWNTTLYWHFVALMTVVTVVVIAVFPRLR